ncbi:DUF2970 domain-containing protein [Paraglaciecola aquimarina]|uniref:DUF2970 domain-containing protein n=1 Tax=Paraglaciecola algarum TaxID=3050085 RepID=A0ABS9D504_9ALTE|nr:DUF2970 domain-containing protein [Paraglaciecola sp. G1-23]MCF2947990.1 DUF2970 domain-containing protein [Paraglaciecola sp. G1-23]
MKKNQKKANWWQVFKGVAASMLGVQSNANYQSDFEQPSFIPFVVVGVIFVLGLIGLLLVVVNLLV